MQLLCADFSYSSNLCTLANTNGESQKTARHKFNIW